MKAATLLRYWIFFFMPAAMMSMSIRCELKKKRGGDLQFSVRAVAVCRIGILTLQFSLPGQHCYRAIGL